LLIWASLDSRGRAVPAGRLRCAAVGLPFTRSRPCQGRRGRRRAAFQGMANVRFCCLRVSCFGFGVAGHLPLRRPGGLSLTYLL